MSSPTPPEPQAGTSPDIAAIVADAPVYKQSEDQPRPGRGKSTDRKGETPRRRRRAPQREGLMSLTEACHLWHGLDGEAFATFPMGAHRETWPIRSQSFKRWLASRAFPQPIDILDVWTAWTAWTAPSLFQRRSVRMYGPGRVRTTLREMDGGGRGPSKGRQVERVEWAL